MFAIAAAEAARDCLFQEPDSSRGASAGEIPVAALGGQPSSGDIGLSAYLRRCELALSCLPERLARFGGRRPVRLLGQQQRVPEVRKSGGQLGIVGRGYPRCLAQLRHSFLEEDIFPMTERTALPAHGKLLKQSPGECVAGGS